MESLSGFIQKQKHTYKLGIGLNHYARRDDVGEFEPMPLTPFVYDLFFYNTLYSVDWEKSCQEHKAVLDASGREKQRQTRFERFLRTMAEQDPKVFYEAFAPITGKSLDGPWTRIDPNSISIEEGDKFFRDLRDLQKLVSNRRLHDDQLLDRVFLRIKECREFVYKVRNDVFHAGSFLWDVTDAQEKRIDVYDTFLRCLLSSFFLLAEDHVR